MNAELEPLARHDPLAMQQQQQHQQLPPDARRSGGRDGWGVGGGKRRADEIDGGDHRPGNDHNWRRRGRRNGSRSWRPGQRRRALENVEVEEEVERQRQRREFRRRSRSPTGRASRRGVNAHHENRRRRRYRSERVLSRSKSRSEYSPNDAAAAIAEEGARERSFSPRSASSSRSRRDRGYGRHRPPVPRRRTTGEEEEEEMDDDFYKRGDESQQHRKRKRRRRRSRPSSSVGSSNGGSYLPYSASPSGGRRGHEMQETSSRRRTGRGGNGRTEDAREGMATERYGSRNRGRSCYDHDHRHRRTRSRSGRRDVEYWDRRSAADYRSRRIHRYDDEERRIGRKTRSRGSDTCNERAARDEYVDSRRRGRYENDDDRRYRRGRRPRRTRRRRRRRSRNDDWLGARSQGSHSPGREEGRGGAGEGNRRRRHHYSSAGGAGVVSDDDDETSAPTPATGGTNGCKGGGQTDGRERKRRRMRSSREKAHGGATRTRRRGNTNDYKEPRGKGGEEKHSLGESSPSSSVSTTDSYSVSSERDDDTFGHFEGGPGTLVADRYRIIRDVGMGTFGRVVECADLRNRRRRRKSRSYESRQRGSSTRSRSSSTSTHDVVAIKIVRSVKRYYESALIEADIVEDVNRRGGRGRSLCAVMLDRFDLPTGHYCLVFECLGRSLYDFLKMHDYRPFPLYCVRDFAHQLLDTLDFLHSFGLIHTDLKPENILLTSNDEITDRAGDGSTHQVPASTKIKVIDFGGATYDNEKKSSVINTRQYRAPEVILGLGWSTPSDMWSAGCIISELYQGELLFATHDNAEHLALMERAVGPFPRDMLNRCTSSLASKCFDSYGWHRLEDALSSSSVSHVWKMGPLETLVDERDRPSGLVQLLRSLLTIDPAFRATAGEALKSPFFSQIG